LVRYAVCVAVNALLWLVRDSEFTCAAVEDAVLEAVAVTVTALLLPMPETDELAAMVPVCIPVLVGVLLPTPVRPLSVVDLVEVSDVDNVALVDDTLAVADGVSDRDSDCDSDRDCDIEGAAEPVPVIVSLPPTPVPVALSLLPV